MDILIVVEMDAEMSGGPAAVSRHFRIQGLAPPFKDPGGRC